MTPSLKITVDFGDALKCDADVLALKYAQGLYGADKAVFGRLEAIGVKASLPEPGDFTLQNSLELMNRKCILFVGVNPL